MFGRVTIQKSTGKLIEFQSGNAPLGALTTNAIKAGIPRDDIEEKYISEIEFNSLLDALPKPEKTPKTDIEKLVEYAKVQKWI